MHESFEIRMVTVERSGIARSLEPIAIGIPFPKGALFNPADTVLTDLEQRICPSYITVISRWSDGSVKWGLLDCQLSVEGKGTAINILKPRHDGLNRDQETGILIEQARGHLMVDTGAAVFEINQAILVPFNQVFVGTKGLLAEKGNCVVLVNELGDRCVPHIDEVKIEGANPLRATVRLRGMFHSSGGKKFAGFMAALTFFQGHRTVEFELTVHNEKAAKHPRELWDLGDQGSIYFKDLSFYTALDGSDSLITEWAMLPDQKTREGRGCLEIYQDSSGGTNWNSLNHVNRQGNITVSFRGYRVTMDGIKVEEGHRADPVVTVRNQQGGISAAVAGFWQNFPKAVESNKEGMVIRLFPRQCSDVFELQGGEQKTHIMFLQFGQDADLLFWVRDRLRPCPEPSWCAASRAVSYLHPRETKHSQDETLDRAEQVVASAIQGEHTFFDRREIIDEYGWRHFGDLYADHEAVQHHGHTPLISHYNNQYDVIFGSLVQYLRGGEHEWFRLAQELAQHVIDIDIYHTDQDRFGLNGGLFWHTDHYTDAGTATHRALTKMSPQALFSLNYGGGPACEHNYTSGLLLYYWMTGDSKAKEAVLTLANWVVNMENGTYRMLGFLDPRPTGYCSSTADRGYHGPGRGAGNSINALLDASQVAPTSSYLEKAEELIRRCIHPQDDIGQRRLEDVELRWSYTVFLQVLGKYLDYKAERAQLDFMYGYAQESLLHYARWMLDHEVPFKTVLDKVAIPTETWPAQDIRKANVFHLAAKHASGVLREALREKAFFFFRACINDLLSFPTHSLTRPVVILMGNTYVNFYFIVHDTEVAPRPTERYTYGRPKQFKPQFDELYKVRDWVKQVQGWVKLLRT